jgi:hypothetical protein
MMKDVPVHRTRIQRASMCVGAVLLLVGASGFVPAFTGNYGTLASTGQNPDSLLPGIFQTVLHNVVHLVLGSAALALARTPRRARTFLIGGGAVYSLLALYGLFVGPEDRAVFLPNNTAKDWLHYILGAGMIALGAGLGSDGQPHD